MLATFGGRRPWVFSRVDQVLSQLRALTLPALGVFGGVALPQPVRWDKAH